MRINRIKKIISEVFVIILVVSQCPLTVSATENIKTDNHRIVVSMGDSYSSGEGVLPFYYQDLSTEEKSKKQDFLAHRSTKSWPGKLTLPDMPEKKTLADYKIDLDELGTSDTDRPFQWFFVAASGAQTKDYKGKQKDKEYKRKGVYRSAKDNALNPQLEIFKQIPKNEVDYVTMTIGGNDVGFAKIIEYAALEFDVYLHPNNLRGMLESKWEYYNDTAAKDIEQAYTDVLEAAGSNANVIVAGYPKLFSDKIIAKQPSHPFFDPVEISLINSSVTLFNKNLEGIIQGLNQKGNKNIYFASVEEAFNGHEAYSLNPYINSVKLIARGQDLKSGIVSAYSMHPNEKGTDAYAACVQKVINKIEAEKKAQSFLDFLTIDEITEGQLESYSGYYASGAYYVQLKYKNGKQFPYQPIFESPPSESPHFAYSYGYYVDTKGYKITDGLCVGDSFDTYKKVFNDNSAKPWYDENGEARSDYDYVKEYGPNNRFKLMLDIDKKGTIVGGTVIIQDHQNHRKKEYSNQLTATDIINIYFDNKSVWAAPEDYYSTVMEPTVYSFIDIDFDGIPELFMSSMQGSAHISINYAYRLNKKNKTIEKIPFEEEPEGSFFGYDLFNEELELLKNNKDGKLHYYAFDCNTVYMEQIFIWGFLELENGIIESKPVFYVMHPFGGDEEDGREVEYGLFDSNEQVQYITEEEYNKKNDGFFKDYTKLNLKYKTVDLNVLQTCPENEQKELFLGSYNAFKYS